jgi:hypothetical protein
MAQGVMAKCRERCGFVGVVRSGWVRVDPSMVGELAEDRLQWRGRELYYRTRLRDSWCPRCGGRGLERVEHLDARGRIRLGRP